MSSRLHFFLPSTVLAAFAAACASTHYQGDPLPLEQLAVLESRDTVVDELDGQPLASIRTLPAKYALPPGPHLVGMSLLRVERGFMLNTVITSRDLYVCFIAKAGARYVAHATISDGTWAPRISEIREERTFQERGVDTSCDRDRLFPGRAPPATAAVPAATQSEQLAIPSQTDEQSQTQSAPVQTKERLMEKARVAAAEAEARLQRRVDGALAVRDLWKGRLVRPFHPRPSADLIVANTGLSFGGDTIAETMSSNGTEGTLSGGSGVTLSLGAMLTPLWIADRLGLGLGAEIGLKYDWLTADNGRISFIRYPVTGTAHALVRLNHHWFALFAGGLETHLSPSISASDSTSGQAIALASRTGGTGRLGAYLRLGDSSAMTFGASYTALTYDVGPEHLDGSSVNLWFAFLLGL